MSFFRSRLVAATNRTSTRIVLIPPTRSNSLSCSARKSQFTCISTGILPDFIEKSVPPFGELESSGLASKPRR